MNLMFNCVVTGWILDNNRALKLCTLAEKHQDPPLERIELEGFCVSGRNPSDINGLAWAARNKTQARQHPAYSLSAFLSGTEQDKRIPVVTGACRLNDFLNGLWASMLGVGRMIPPLQILWS